MSKIVTSSKSSMLTNVSTPPPMTPAAKLALEISADNTRNNGKQSTPAKVAQTPAESSVKFAELLIERIASKSAVQATGAHNVISVTSDFIVTMNLDYGFDVSGKDSAEFSVISTTKKRRNLRVNLSFDELLARLPAKTASTRVSGVKYEFSVTASDLWEYAFPAESDVLNKLTELRFDKTNRIPSCVINGIKFVGITRTRLQVYPSRFVDGKYIPARISKDKKTGKVIVSDNAPEREIYVICITFADGTHVILRDQGVANLQAKIQRLQTSEVVANTTINLEETFVWTPPAKKSPQENDDDVDTDDDDTDDDE